MNRLQSSPAPQTLAGGPNNRWSTVAPFPPPYLAASATVVSPEPPLFFHQQYPPPPPLLSSWLDNQDFPDYSLTQLLMSGVVREEDKSILSHFEEINKSEDWEEQPVHDSHHQHHQINSMVESCIKKENLPNNYASYGHGNVEIQGLNPIIQDSSPNSCVTSCNFLDFSTTTSKRHPPPDRSSECNSTATGGATKKAKIQPSSSQSTFKVRKEKLGDRITALHQIVSPFGKTDTASVLLEAIGYIRFLHSQIEALSLPYMGNASASMRDHQHSVQQVGGNCLFPEDPGQLLDDNRMKKKSAPNQDSLEETKKDLRSRGLCLVPISCTMQVGSDNGADYWNGGF